MTKVLRFQENALISLGAFLLSNGDIEVARKLAGKPASIIDDVKAEKSAHRSAVEIVHSARGISMLHPCASCVTICDTDGKDIRLVRAEKAIRRDRMIYVSDPWLVLTGTAIKKMGSTRQFLEHCALTVVKMANPFVDTDAMAQLHPRIEHVDSASEVIWTLESPLLVSAQLRDKVPSPLEIRKRILVFRKLFANALPTRDGESLAIYTVGSLFNHSCDANARVHLTGPSSAPVMNVYALRDIEEDEEITINYLTCEFPAPRVECLRNNPITRREVLKNRFGFDCLCDLCCHQIVVAAAASAAAEEKKKKDSKKDADPQSKEALTKDE